MIKFKNVQLNDQGAVEYWESIYVEAFPEAERVPLEKLLTMSQNNSDVLMQIIQDDELPIGIILMATMATDKAFVLYFAMDAAQRGQGYGSKVLPALQAEYPDGIILETEVLDAEADNAEQRERRLAFYKRNGMMDSDFMSSTLGGVFHLMRSTETITVDDYLKALTLLGGIPTVVFNKMNQKNFKQGIQ